MRTWLVALRIARREAGRAKGRTALAVAMIGLPVLALSFAATALAMSRLTPAEQVSREMGRADATLTWMGSAPVGEGAADAPARGFGTDGHTAAEVLALLPPGSTVTKLWTTSVPMRVAGGQAIWLSARGLDVADPLTRGMVRLLSGRAPAGDTEVVLTPGALRQLGARVGGVVGVYGSATPYKVVGTVEVGGLLDDEIVFPPDTRPVPPTHFTQDTSDDGYTVEWLAGLRHPLPDDEINRLDAMGVGVVTRASLLNPPPSGPAPPGGDTVQTFAIAVVLVGLAALEVVLLAGPAFAVGARRRRRDLALVAAAGAPPAVLRRIVLADGVVAGLLAAVAGSAAGIGLAVAGRPLVEQYVIHERLGAFRVYPWMVVAVAAVSVGIGLLAALAPALAAARQDVIATLAGRRGARRSRRRWLIAGVTITGIGVVVAAYGALADKASVVVPGLAAGEIGLVMCTPALVGLVARFGRLLPLGPRLAVRDTARRRAAAAPAIAAVMAAVAGSVAITVYLTAQNADHQPYGRSLPLGSMVVDGTGRDGPPSQPVATATLTDAVHSVLPNASVVGFRSLACPLDPTGDTGACAAQLVMPDATRCPFEPVDGLSRADQRAAAADPRCAHLTFDAIGYSNGIFVADSPTVVAALTGLAGPDLDRAVATLRAGGILVTDKRYVQDGHATLGWFAPDARDKYVYPPLSATTRSVQLPAFLVTSGVYWYRPVLGPAAVARLGGTSVEAGVLVTPTVRATTALAQTLTAALDVADPAASLYVEDGDPTGPTTPAETPLILAIAAGIIALGAAVIATGLAVAEGREELATLAAVGAGPAIRRVLALAQAATISGLGALIGAVAGFGMAAAVLTGLNHQVNRLWPAPTTYPVTVPWLDFAVTLIAVPLVAMAGAGLLVRSRLPSERRAA